MSVAIVREGDQGLDYLVLFDSVIVLRPIGRGF